MEIENETIEPDNTSFSRRVAETVVVSFINALPVVLLLLSIIGGTHYAISHWHVSLLLAIPFGLLVGLAFAAFAMIGNGTLFEAGMRCTIILVLVLIVFPLFASLRHKVDAAKRKAATAAHRMP